MESGSKKRKIPKGSSSRAEKVNRLTPEIAKKLYDREILKFSKTIDGCRVSTKSTDIGQYAIMTIPEKYLPDIEQSKDRRVNVTHMALRSTGVKIPLYEEGIDVKHSCGRGKVSETNPHSCIDLNCLSLGDHKSNMSEQRCQPIMLCSHCGLYSKICQHIPGCTSALTAKFASQPNVVKVTIEYEDGTTTVVKPSKLE
jgi:hypothetical protein